MNKQKALWNTMARKNSRFYIASFKGKGITEKEFRQSGEDDYKRLLTIKGESEDIKGKFLEIGCGTGRMTEFIAQDWDEVVAVDISDEMIKQGKKRLAHVGNITWMENDGENLDLKDNSIDFAFSYLVYQHVKTKGMVKRGIREVCRVLKPGGVFLAFLRHKEEPLRWWNGGVAWMKEEIPDLIKGFKLLSSDYKEDCYTFWLWLEKL